MYFLKFIVSLILYLIGDFTARGNSGCINWGGYILNFLVGGLSGCIITSLMYAGGSGKFLPYDDFSKN
jgi:hypothetical protein